MLQLVGFLLTLMMMHFVPFEVISNFHVHYNEQSIVTVFLTTTNTISEIHTNLNKSQTVTSNTIISLLFLFSIFLSSF